MGLMKSRSASMLHLIFNVPDTHLVDTYLLDPFSSDVRLFALTLLASA